VQFTQEHHEIRRTLRSIIDKDINPHVDKWEENGIFPAHEVFKKLGDAGLLGINKPIEYGGMGLDYSYAMVMAEELGHINCGSVPMAIGVQTDMATPALARYGSNALRKEFLAPSISGDYVACLGVSEVGAGSDVASIKTTARKVGGDWVINGGKMWTTNGTQADWMCLLAGTGEGPAHKNKSLICLPMKTKGVQIVKKLDKLQIEEIGADARKVLASLDETLKGVDVLLKNVDAGLVPDLRRTLDTAAQTLKSAEGTLKTAEGTLSSVSPLQSDLQQTLSELNRTLTAVRALAEFLQQHPESLIRGKSAP